MQPDIVVLLIELLLIVPKAAAFCPSSARAIAACLSCSVFLQSLVSTLFSRTLHEAHRSHGLRQKPRGAGAARRLEITCKNNLLLNLLAIDDTKTKRIASHGSA
jgi:hypothetical protein